MEKTIELSKPLLTPLAVTVTEKPVPCSVFNNESVSWSKLN